VEVRLDGKKALVTGASSGIGLAAARAMAERGARLALIARSEEGLEQAAELVRKTGAETITATADVTDRDALGAAVGLTGLALLSRSATNTGLRALVTGERGIDVQKAITIVAPIDDVFAFFTNYENFPRFMSHVREVRDTGNNGSHWVVDGPAGVPVEWDAVLTELVPNQVLAWVSVPGSVVESSGVIRFAQNEDGSTHVDLKMTYAPPAGAIGHAASKLLGVDPKRQMDDDLARAKTYLETGKPAHDAAQRADAR